jgi:hypothetical protein
MNLSPNRLAGVGIVVLASLWAAPSAWAQG